MTATKKPMLKNIFAKFSKIQILLAVAIIGIAGASTGLTYYINNSKQAAAHNEGWHAEQPQAVNVRPNEPKETKNTSSASTKKEVESNSVETSVSSTPQSSPTSSPQKGVPPKPKPVSKITLTNLDNTLNDGYWFETDGVTSNGYLLVWYRIDRTDYEYHKDAYPPGHSFWDYYGGQTAAGFSYRAYQPQGGAVNLLDLKTTMDSGDYQIYVCVNEGGRCGVKSNIILRRS